MPLRNLSALALVATLALSACSSDDPEPKVAPEPTASTPSAVASPSASASAANDDMPDDEVAFIDLFYAAFTEAISTGDPAGFMVLADESCTNCKTLAKNLRAAYKNGGRIVDGDWTVLSAEPDLGDDDNVWEVRVRTARERWLDASGETVKTVAPSIQTVAMALQQDAAGWRVRELKLR
ncbi:DUF6318 family protein [Nocardioides deserti]|uniref:DUF6318 domain-containing protein n=1 Tax=Nocardioides deserti TaxID=1588644 RepID=A0ABR6UC59_9ACTN|nr:DUF6318 family protein [Nocardioides deserti]MBC2962025.1 hypothetical protein [Nocardioides deserti]GGO78816.1 hypothetical protein GCM10012276_37080 [Nocardioides deserti]